MPTLTKQKHEKKSSGWKNLPSNVSDERVCMAGVRGKTTPFLRPSCCCFDRRSNRENGCVLSELKLLRIKKPKKQSKSPFAVGEVIDDTPPPKPIDTSDAPNAHNDLYRVVQ